MRTILVHLNVKVPDDDPRCSGKTEAEAEVNFGKFYEAFEGIISVGNDPKQTGIETSDIVVAMIDEV